MIQAHTMQNGRLQIMHMNRIFHHVITQLIGFTQRLTFADATARHPHGEGSRMMITPVDPPQGGIGFHHGGAPEFAAPHNQRVFQQTTLFEIPQQGRAGLIRLFALALQTAHHIGMMIPTFVIQLNKTNPPLDQTPRQKTVVCKRLLSGFGSVHLHGCLGFLGQIHEFGSAGLHAVGHLVIINTGLNLRIFPICQGLLVQGIDQSDGPFLNRSINADRTGHI